MLFEFTAGLIQTNKFDAECAELADRHYSRQKKGSRQFAPPGETIILRDAQAMIVFVWNRMLQKRADHQEGANCTIFRNESNRLSSEIILEAETFAVGRWGEIRGFTYIDRNAIQSLNPGYCFKMAGWKLCGKSESGKLLLEKQLRTSALEAGNFTEKR
jgi:hypothetical protein